MTFLFFVYLFVVHLCTCLFVCCALVYLFRLWWNFNGEDETNRAKRGIGKKGKRKKEKEEKGKKRKGKRKKTLNESSSKIRSKFRRPSEARSVKRRKQNWGRGRAALGGEQSRPVGNYLIAAFFFFFFFFFFFKILKWFFFFFFFFFFFLKF